MKWETIILLIFLICQATQQQILPFMPWKSLQGLSVPARCNHERQHEYLGASSLLQMKSKVVRMVIRYFWYTIPVLSNMSLLVGEVGNPTFPVSCMLKKKRRVQQRKCKEWEMSSAGMSWLVACFAGRPISTFSVYPIDLVKQLRWRESSPPWQDVEAIQVVPSYSRLPN